MYVIYSRYAIRWLQFDNHHCLFLLQNHPNPWPVYFNPKRARPIVNTRRAKRSSRICPWRSLRGATLVPITKASQYCVAIRSVAWLGTLQRRRLPPFQPRCSGRPWNVLPPRPTRAISRALGDPMDFTFCASRPKCPRNLDPTGPFSCSTALRMESGKFLVHNHVSSLC